MTLTLTTGTDDLIGAATNDTIIATPATLNPGDKIDAGAGIDTMMLTDTTTAPASALNIYGWFPNVLGVEVLNLSTTGGVNANFPNGNLAKLNVNAAGTGDVSVWAWSATSVAITGANMSYASVRDAANVSIDNPSAAGVSGQGTSLTKVRLDKVADVAPVIKGAGLTTLELSNIHHDAAVKVVNATAGHSLTLALYDAGGATYGSPAVKLSVTDTVATSVSIVANGSDALTLATSNATTLSLSGNGLLTLDLNASVNTKLVSINADSTLWGINLSNVPASVRTIVTGTGADKLNVAVSSVKDDVATAAVDETSNASIATGAGADTIALTSTGNGKITLNAGLGDDKLMLSGRTGNEILDIALNEGSDFFDAAPGVQIKDADKVDGGPGYGVDVLSLHVVDAANAGVFSAFEAIDIVGLNRTVDLAMLSAKNKIERVIVSGPVGTAGLSNLSANATIDIVADMGASTLAVQRQPNEYGTLEIKTAGYEQEPDLAADSVTATISLAGANRVSLSMQSGFYSALPGEASAGDNLATVNLTTTDTTVLSVNSEGTEANNVLNLNDPNYKLTTLNLSGYRPLTVNLATGSLQYVNANYFGGLTFSTAVMANGGVISLGYGQDSITVVAGADGPKMVTLGNFQVLPDAKVNAAVSDADRASAIAHVDTMTLKGAGIANASAVAGGAVGARGILTFTNPAGLTLANAFQIANLAAETDGEALLFELNGDSYVFRQNGAADVSVKLSSVKNVAAFNEILSSDAFYLVGSVYLTDAVDTIVGTPDPDHFFGFGLTAGDKISGGAGLDTLDLSLDYGYGSAKGAFVPAGAVTVSGVEQVSVKSSYGLDMDISTWVGVERFTVDNSYQSLTLGAPDSADVVVTGYSSGPIVIKGGRSLDAQFQSNPQGVSISGKALTSVSLRGGSQVTVDNLGSGGESGAGTTLKEVTLIDIGRYDTNPVATVLKGAALTSLKLGYLMDPQTIEVINSTAGHVLNLELASTGYYGEAAILVKDAVAAAATISALGDRTLTLSGAKLESVLVGGAGTLALAIDPVSTKLTSIDGSAATGGLTLTGLGAGVRTVLTGTGADTLTMSTATVIDDPATAAVNEAVSLKLGTGEGNDAITLATTGNGAVTVDAGNGNDQLHLASRSGSETLQLSLGSGNDKLTAAAAVAVNATDSIDGGTGVDTLAGKLVGAANAAAFSGFEIVDVAGLGKSLDLDLLAAKNTLTEVMSTGAVGSNAAITNMGTGVGFRATHDTGALPISLTQKSPGAMTITAAFEEQVKPSADLKLSATAYSATSFDIHFDNEYAYLWDDGVVYSRVSLMGGAATSIHVFSDGYFSLNALDYADHQADGSGGGKLVSVLVTGASPLALSVSAINLATIDASAQTGGLSVSTASVANMGIIKLGEGADRITVAASSSTNTGIEQIAGFDKAWVEALGASPWSEYAISHADKLVLAGASVAEARSVSTAGGAGTLGTKGVLSFGGAGPATLADALAIADAAANAAGKALVFNYLGDSYVFVQGGADDTVVKLVGTTGITNFVETGVDNFFIV